MINQNKKWLIVVLITVMLLISGIIAVNLVVDAYGLMRTDFSKQVREPNLNYIKIKFLLKNKDRYDSFLFGSSRVNHIDVKKIPGGRWYNMGCSEGLPGEHLENIRHMLKNGIKIKNIIIGIDDFSWMINPAMHRQDLMRQPYPAISGKNIALFYGEYYLKLNNFFDSAISYAQLLRSKDNAVTQKKVIFDYFDSGRPICPSCDEEIEKDPAKHAQDPKFREPFHHSGDNMTGALADIRAIVKLAEESGITLTIFFHPLHKTSYLDNDLGRLNEFKRGLAAIRDYYDFSGLNSITTNNYYYYETSHFRPMVGDMILNRIFGRPDVKVPNDFGVLVTRNNVASHIARLESEARTYRPVSSCAER